MEKTIVKIKSLKVKNLYGHIGYDINFNDNITFLYGDNGCGKTTILNIITYIITGKIYRLLEYHFDEIALTFQSSTSKKQQKIIITRVEDNSIVIDFSSEKFTIDQRTVYLNRSSEEIEDADHYYLSKYPVLKEIRNIFNYIYLPLNRSGFNIVYPYDYRARKLAQARYNHYKNRFIDNNYDLFEIESLVASAYNRENTMLNRINEEFSDDILKSVLDVDDFLGTDKIYKHMMTCDATMIRKMQSDYITVLRTLNKWDELINEKINAFFDSLINDINSAKLHKDVLNIDFLLKLLEVSKITNIIDKAKNAEEAKKSVKRPIEDFLNTVNSFIYNCNSRKKICIDEDGNIFLKTVDDKKVSIQNMSSGEKQILIFFAYLIFGLETTKQSIFIVDEPELSLHLNWQRQFVDAIMNINENVQLIFATHAPEIIGKRRDKAIKLIPTI